MMGMAFVLATGDGDVPAAQEFFGQSDRGVLPFAADVVVLGFGAVAVAALALSFHAFTQTDDPEGRFERCYATVNARVVEGVFWVVHHSRRALAGDAVDARAPAAGW